MIYFEYFFNFLNKIPQTLVIQNNTIEIIHVIWTLRIVCGFLDKGDECYFIFNKNQVMFAVRKSITAQILKNVLFVTIKSHLVKPLFAPS